MPVNLLAVCREANGLTVKRVKVTADVQSQLEGVFIQQEQEFLDGITEEIAFDGGWRPESNELLFTPVTDEAAAVLAAAQGNIVAMPDVNAANFAGEGIRALAVLVQRPAGPRLLLQEFSARQLLEKRFSLILDGETFSRLTEPAFAIGASLAGMIDDGRIKFTKYSRIRQIFDLTSMYQEATDAELDAFCGLDSLDVGDTASFKSKADQTMRKLIHAITKRDTLNDYTPEQIATAAAGEGFQVAVVNNRLVVPTEKADAKALLHFLDNGLYRAAFGGEIFITNSKRRYSPAAH
jgi:hypothetical protein